MGLFNDIVKDIQNEAKSEIRRDIRSALRNGIKVAKTGASNYIKDRQFVKVKLLRVKRLTKKLVFPIILLYRVV